MIKRICLKCSKEFLWRASSSRVIRNWGKFCSRNCSFLIKKGQRLSPKTEFKKGELNGIQFQKGMIPWNIGIPMSDKQKQILSRANKGTHHGRELKKGQKSWLKDKKGYKNNGSFNNGLDSRRTNIFQKGREHPNWKGGITPINKLIRHSFIYIQWRQAIFERDNYTCQFCFKRGGILHADHIKSFALFPELRFELSNGRTLCVDCHKKTPTYGVNLIKPYTGFNSVNL